MQTIQQRQKSTAIRSLGAATGRLSRCAKLIALVVIVQSFAGGFRFTHAQSVQAVLFFAPTCQHCHQVITQYLPGLFEQTGGAPSVSVDASVADAERALYLFHNDRLEILLVDASKSIGTVLYGASTENQEVPPDRLGVPRMVIGDSVLVGSYEIPQITGDLVQQGLDGGGLAWPAVDGLLAALESIPVPAAPDVTAVADSATGADVEPEDRIATEPEPTAATGTVQRSEVSDTTADVASPGLPPTEALDTLVAPSRLEAESSVSVVEEPGDSQATAPSVFEVVPAQRPTMLENFGLDPVGNSLSVVVLVLMIASIVAVGVKADALPTGLGVTIPLLALVGAIVAGYLTYIETTGATAVCGPVGDCNTVNQSEWARLFGVLPVGTLGLLGYDAIVLAWAFSRYSSGLLSAWARLSLGVMTVGGTLFSVYLTFLEPFVIGATCAWCLTSSIIITALMWFTVGAARDAWRRIRDNSTAGG